MKRFLTFFFLTIAICPVFTTVGYSEVSLVHVVFPQKTPIAVGERLNVDIQIADAQDIAGYELTVSFDPTVLRYIGGGNADYLPEGAFALSPIASNDSVYIAATSVVGAAAASAGTLATLTFEVVAISASTLQLKDVILSNSAGMSLPVTTRSGRIETIQSLPIGDVNGDRSVNILDLTLVASSLTVGTPTPPRADVNEDGTVNILDMVLVAQHLDAIGGNTVKSKVGVIPVNPDVTAGIDIDFAAEDQAIRDLYAEYALAHGDQDVDALTDVWLPGESKDIFTAWTFWAGTFEKNEGGKAVSKAWDGIFRLRGGKMEVDITYIAIDSRGKEAVLRGAYTWGNQKGDLISALKKDGTDWKIRAIDYTDGRFGRQVKDLLEPAHIFEENPENRQAAVATRPPIDFAAEKAAIQAVYSAFYKAFNDNDLKAIGETFRTNDGKVAFGTIFAGNEPVPIAFGWRNVEIAIEGLWIGIGTKGAKWGRDDVLKDFWIRYKGSKIEASVIGYNCYKGSFPGETHLYLMKEAKDGWKIHELDSSTENNLGIFGFHKGKPRLKEAGRFFTTDADKVPE
ncbi:MAG: hypothetical protein F4X55_00690 [Candidatus Dadabacteria bacterium]|nr:hypothetical protein [Candidatus Dadabacteria bacterium]